MLVEKSQEYERRVRALRKRLALDFHPLRDTLSRGLDVLIDPEAAVLCTATVEAMCDALFNAIVRNLHEEASASLAPLDTKITLCHIQVALRSHADFAQLLEGVEGAAAVLEYFLDDATSRTLYDRQLIASRGAKHLRSTAMLPREDQPQQQLSEEELIAMHERTRSEWQKRDDDPFTEVDFAAVLKCVHPAFTLAYSATMLLSALVRELLNEVCDRANVEAVQRRVPPELYVEDLALPLAQVFHIGEVGRHIERVASECLERFRLRSRQGATLTLRFRVYSNVASAAQSFKAHAANHALQGVARDTKFALLLPQMCKKCHLDAAATVGIYRGHQLEAYTTPASLSMPTGAVLYLVSKKWWDHTRRNEARRGLLSSLRPQDAHVKALVESTESKVKREFQGASPTGNGGFGFLAPSAAPPAVLLRRDDNLDSKRMAKSKSVHAASASRLLGVASTQESPQRRRRRSGASDADEEEEHEDDAGEEQDSLSRLLRQKRTSAARGLDNNGSKRHEELLQTLAAQSTQLMDRLDEAWLGFAGISAGVRGLRERLQDAQEEPARWRALEEELAARLEKSGALARQTAEAHAMVAQLLEGARRLRR